MTTEEIRQRIDEIESDIRRLPAGTLVYKTINGKRQPYLQWSEGGKTRSRYIKISERDTTLQLVEMRKRLQAEARALETALADVRSRTDRAGAYEYVPVGMTWGVADRSSAGYIAGAFRTRVVAGAELDRMTESVRAFDRRGCYRRLKAYLDGTGRGTVCLLYGLRRTGKTTLLLQAINDLSGQQRSTAAYIKARVTDSMADINHDLKLLADSGYRYIFVDEVTLISDFIDSAALFSDVFAMQGIRIVLSGTDSLGFWMSLTNELYDRAAVIHTTYIPFAEHSRLLGTTDIDEYIRYGGTLRAGETDLGSKDAIVADAAFRDDESTRRYIDTAICHNIQHSLACCSGGQYFRHLRELYDTGELTGAINRIIERMNHRFLLQTLIERFKSHDLGSAAEVLRKQADVSRRTDILDRIDKGAVTRRLMEMLDIKDLEDQKTGITTAHVEEIREYLEALDLVTECPAQTMTGGGKDLEYCLFTQPGMRYSQAQALVHVLMQNEEFASFAERDRMLACDRILEEVRGRMMEDIVLLDTSRSLEGGKRAFKLTLARGEIDMVIYDPKTDTCGLYEVKHSMEAVPHQYHVLEDISVLTEVEKRYGSIEKRCVIYRGQSQTMDNGIEYLNACDYLAGLTENS